VSRFPMGNVLSLMGRYAYGRRSDQVGGLYQEMNLLAAVQTFGGPPAWVFIPTNQCSWSDSTGEVWVPAGLLLAYYSDVKIKYVAGYQTIPEPIVRATAMLARTMIADGSGFGSSLRSLSAGDSRIERFAASAMDSDVKNILEPYRSRLFY
jgi:hypothetical protein